VIGKSKLDFVLTEGRSEIAQRQEVLIQEIMDLYGSGIVIAKVEMQSAKPPEQVKAAFDDAIKAREDEQKSVNQAEAYKNDIIPKARGGAARLREEASGYKAKVIAKAEGEASRFEQLLAEYQRAPEVTRQRLYIDTIESVLSSSSKVLMDTDSGNSLMYLPIDKLLERRSNTPQNVLSVPGQFRSDAQSRIQDSSSGQTGSRSRGVR
jgi:membrane protease subunit HflK